MPDLTQVITSCNIVAYTRRYVSLLHIAKVSIWKYDSDFISTTVEAQAEWDYKALVCSKQKEGLDIYCAVFGLPSWESGTAHENTEKELPVKKSGVGEDTSQSTVSPFGYVEEHGYTYPASLCTTNSSILMSFILSAIERTFFVWGELTFRQMSMR